MVLYKNDEINFLHKQLRHSKLSQLESPVRRSAGVKKSSVHKVTSEKQPALGFSDKKSFSATKQSEKPKRKSLFEVMNSPKQKSALKKSPSEESKRSSKKPVISKRFAKLKKIASQSSMNISHGVISGRRRQSKLPAKYKESEIDPDTKRNKEQLSPIVVCYLYFLAKSLLLILYCN